MSLDLRKDARRLALGPDFSIEFKVQGRSLTCPLLNLSYGGCFTLVPFREARHFDRGVELVDFHLAHPDLPQGLIPAQVAYTLGGSATHERMDHVGMGIQFTSIPPLTRAALQAWIDREWDRRGL